MQVAANSHYITRSNQVVFVRSLHTTISVNQLVYVAIARTGRLKNQMVLYNADGTVFGNFSASDRLSRSDYEISRLVEKKVEKKPEMATEAEHFHGDHSRWDEL